MRYTKKGSLDKRFRKLEEIERNFWQQYGALIGTTILGFMAGAILAQTLWNAFHPEIISPKGLGVTRVPRVYAMEKEKDWDTDLVGYFRFKGQQLGYSDYLITRLHTVMDCENGLHTADRVNYLYTNENGRYTAAGFAMITKSTFNDKQFKCTGDRFNGVDSIDCFYKIYAKTGLKRYTASKSCWSK